MPATDVATFAPGKQVVHAGAWRSLLGACYYSHFHVRRIVLGQINSLLHFSSHRSANLRSLMTQRGWADWVLALLDDVADDMAGVGTVASDLLQQRVAEGRVVEGVVPASALSEGERLVCHVYQLTMHVVVLALVEAFFNDDSTVAEEAPVEPPAEQDLPEDFNPHLNLNNVAVCGALASYPHYLQYHADLVHTHSRHATAPARIRSLAPLYGNGFLVPLAQLGRAAACRPLCFRSQLRDAMLVALSRSHAHNYTLPRAILTSCVVKLQRVGGSRGSASVPLHLRLEQIAYLLSMVRAFVFAVPVTAQPAAVAGEDGDKDKDKERDRDRDRQAADTDLSHLCVPGYAFVLGATVNPSSGAALDAATLPTAAPEGPALSPVPAGVVGAETWVREGGALHWQEQHGLALDGELLERAAAMLVHMRFLSLTTPAATAVFAPAATDTPATQQPVASPMPTARRYGTIRIGAGGTSSLFAAARSAAAVPAAAATAYTHPQAVASGAVSKPPATAVWSSLTALSLAEQEKPDARSLRLIREIQTVGEFLKDAAGFLALMRERVRLLTPAQASALVREYIALKNRQKIFTSKLQM
jgi:hypothetical protein